MEQYISYMYRIYPNDKQKELIAKTFGCHNNSFVVPTVPWLYSISL